MGNRYSSVGLALLFTAWRLCWWWPASQQHCSIPIVYQLVLSCAFSRNPRRVGGTQHGPVTLFYLLVMRSTSHCYQRTCIIFRGNGVHSKPSSTWIVPLFFRGRFFSEAGLILFMAIHCNSRPFTYTEIRPLLFGKPIVTQNYRFCRFQIFRITFGFHPVYSKFEQLFRSIHGSMLSVGYCHSVLPSQAAFDFGPRRTVWREMQVPRGHWSNLCFFSNTRYSPGLGCLCKRTIVNGHSVT